ncbi:MAG: HEPN domain-containing protein [Deltaproteobacteria bacterium]|nr:HEPN domain-containing protein [Deltaproteobacteria bacterium]
MKKDAKAEAIRYWWDKAAQSLDAARRDLAAKSLSFAVNRAYYALFYAVSALLLEEGRRFRKHSGVRATFNQYLIKTGRLARKHGDLYNRLFRDRQEGDYVEFTKFDEQYVREQINGCEEFLREIRPLIKTLAERNSDPT